MRKLVLIWFLLAAANLGAAVANAGFASLPADGDPAVSVWFSPSGPAEAVRGAGVLHPVAERPEDVAVVMAMRGIMERNPAVPAETALELARRNPSHDWTLPTEIGLWRNRAFALAHGGRLPLVLRRPAGYSLEGAGKFLSRP